MQHVCWWMSIDLQLLLLKLGEKESKMLSVWFDIDFLFIPHLVLCSVTVLQRGRQRHRSRPSQKVLVRFLAVEVERRGDEKRILTSNSSESALKTHEMRMPACCNSKVESMWCNAEMVGHTGIHKLLVMKKTLMSWLSRVTHLTTFPVILYRTECVVLTAALLFPLAKRSSCRCYMSPLDCSHFLIKLFPHCRHFIRRFTRVTLSAHLSSATTFTQKTPISACRSYRGIRSLYIICNVWMHLQNKGSAFELQQYRHARRSGPKRNRNQEKDSCTPSNSPAIMFGSFLRLSD